MPAIATGDFACVPAGGAVGIGISLGEWAYGATRWTRYTHALVYAGYLPDTPLAADTAWVRADPHGQLGPGHYVFEAAPAGARYRKLAGEPAGLGGALWSTGKIPLTAHQREMIADESARKLGTPYSWADYAALAAHRLGAGWLGLKDYVSASGHMICSQLVDWLYLCAGVHLFRDGRWPGYVDPWHLANLLDPAA